MSALVYILLCLIWGSTWMAIKLGLGDLTPMWGAGLRFTLAVTILHAVVMVKHYRLPSTARGFLKLGYPGVYMYGLSYAFVYTAEQFISSALTSVLFASLPMFVSILGSRVFRTETLGRTGWLGLLLGLIGVVTVFYDSLQLSGDILLGTVLALAASFCAAYGLLLHKRSFAETNITVAAAVQMTVGGVPLLLLAAVMEDFGELRFTPTAIGSILYLAVFGSVVAFAGYYWLLRRVKIVTLSLIAFITPVVAILIGVVGFGESLTAPVVVGTVFIMTGVILVVKDKTPDP
ncbi:MAG: EamA family transporter [bacterium]